MSTITLPNIRVSSDLTVGVVLKDGGVAIDWSTLSNIKAYLYADAQRAMAGRCSVAVDEEDSTRLVCSYRANKPQYIGVNRIVITCTYRGETKTFDKPALNFVRWTDDQAGQQITIDDPDVDVEIEVEDVSSSILEQAIAAALQAAADAEHAAHLIPNQVLLDCEQATAGANAAAEAANAAGITSVNVSVEDNEPGTPSAECTLVNKVLSIIFHYLKGETGDAAGFGAITATVDDVVGDPSVTVTASGPDTAKVLAFAFHGLRGIQGVPGVANAKYKQVDTLPTASADTMDFIYLTPSGTSGVYDMSYTEQDGSTFTWRDLGTTAIQLSDYATKAEVSQLDQKVDGLHKVISRTITTAWGEVAIDKIPNGTKIVKVETSVSAKVYLRTNASGSEGQQQISDGVTTEIDAYYILASVPCNITVTYGYIDEVRKSLSEEFTEKIDELHKTQSVTTTTAWFEVEIDTIPSGTKIVKVETSVSAEVYLRDVIGGSQGQQRIINGTVTEFDAPYLLTSVPCNVTLVYGYVDEKLEEVDAELEEITVSAKGLYNKQSATTTGAWEEVAIDTIPSGTIIAEVITSVPASVALRLDASGAQGSQEITNGSVTTFDAHYLVTSVPCTVTLKIGIVAGLQHTVDSKLSKIQNAIITEWCTDNPDGNIAIRDICIYDESALPTDVYHISTLTNNGTYAQLSILKNYEIVSNFWSTNVNSLPLITEIPPYNNSGISAKAIIDWSNIPANGTGRINNKKVNNKFSIIPYLQNAVSPDSRWSGKKMLAIGDSVTVGGQWANEVGRILGMSVSIHAKAGVGVITMVDGDSTLPALSSADVADKDLICIMGLYNERSASVNHPGDIGDMYPTQNSFIGRLNYAVDKIYQKLDEAGNHNCILVIISGHKYGRNQWANRSAYDTVTVGGVQMQDGDALLAVTKKAADYNSIPLIDLMNGGNINKYNWNYFQNSSTPYNTAYIPADGENDGTNKPFASLSVAPDASQNNGKYITVVGVQNCYRSNGSEWVADATPYVWYGDQLHPNSAGYLRIASHIAQQLLTI